MLASEGRLDLAMRAPRSRHGRARRAVPSAVEASRALAKAHQQAGRLDDALATYRRAVAARAGDRDGALRPRDPALESRSRRRGAHALHADRSRETPRHPQATTTARYALGRIAEQDGRSDEAVAHFRRLAADGGDGDLAREARWRLAWMPYRRGDLAAAGEAFAALGNGSDEGSRRLVVLARTHARRRGPDRREPDALRRRADARRRTGTTPTSPSKRLGDAGTARHPPRRRSRRDTAVRASPCTTTIGAAAASSRAVGHERRRRPASSRRSTRELPDGGEREPFLLAAYSRRRGHRRGAPTRAAPRVRRLPPSTLAAYLYPRAYWPRVTTAADRERLDPYVVRRADAAGEPLRCPTPSRRPPPMVSCSCSSSTASRVAGTHDRARRRSSIPTTNIDLGTRYLRQLLDRYRRQSREGARRLQRRRGGGRQMGAPHARRGDRRVRRDDQLPRDAPLREAGARQLSPLPAALRRAGRAAGGRAVSAPRLRRRARARAPRRSLPASPPNPPFDISTTTSPGADLTRDQRRDRVGILAGLRRDAARGRAPR